MRYLLLILLALPVHSADFQEKPDGSMVITMSPEEMLACMKRGGCAIVSMQDLDEIAKQYAAYMCGKTI